MPPKKRARRAAPAAPEPEPEPVPSDDENASGHNTDSDSGASPTSDEANSNSPSIKFFNTTFSTFRVSPLCTARGNSPLTPSGRDTLSRRLRDTLVGDVVRGVQVGGPLDGSDGLGRLGSLVRVEWRECGLDTISPGLAQQQHGQRKRGRDDDTERDERERARHYAICLELEYENATFNALMLPSLGGEEMLDGEHGDEEGLSRWRDLPSWTHQPTNSDTRGKGKGKGKEVDTGKRKDPHDEVDDNMFIHYPLLLTRMPARLKAVLVDFLASTFDCRVSPLRLGTRTLVRSWERWIGDSGVGVDAAGASTLNKDLALTLGFHLEPPPSQDDQKQEAHDEKTTVPIPRSEPTPPIALGLKTIDVIVPAEEVRRFLRIGKKKKRRTPTIAPKEEERHRRRRLGGNKDEEGWTWRSTRDDDTEEEEQTTFDQPFTDALALYLNHHLALDLFHPGVRVLRVVCDAFALSEGRVKVFAQHGGDRTEAAETFVRDLVRCASGPGWSLEARKLAALEVMA